MAENDTPERGGVLLLEGLDNMATDLAVVDPSTGAEVQARHIPAPTNNGMQVGVAWYDRRRGHVLPGRASSNQAELPDAFEVVVGDEGYLGPLHNMPALGAPAVAATLHSKQ